MYQLDWNETKTFISESGAEFKFLEKERDYYIHAKSGWFEVKCFIKKTEPKNSEQIDFEDNYKSLASKKPSSLVVVSEQTPFAKPDYRTKFDALPQWYIITPSENKVLDFQLTEERYVTGGEIIFKNAKEGDYITAEVYDTNSVIPEAYRASLCEAWPSVAKYIPKKWIVPTEVDKYSSFVIDTYPLNAKISAGLYLRVTYHASAETGDRKCTINYNLTKKL